MYSILTTKDYSLGSYTGPGKLTTLASANIILNQLQYFERDKKHEQLIKQTRANLRNIIKHYAHKKYAP